MGTRSKETKTPSAAALAGEAAAAACANADDKDEDDADDEDARDGAASNATASNRNERRPTRIKLRSERRAAPALLPRLRCAYCETAAVVFIVFTPLAFDGGSSTDSGAAPAAAP